MPYNFFADSIHAKKLCSRLFFQVKCNFTRKTAVVRIELPPPLGSIGATYDVHLRLIGERVVDFLLVLMELVRYVLRLRRYERISIENRRLRSNRVSLPQNFKWMGSPR